MDQPDYEGEAQFTQPVSQFLTLLIIISTVLFGAYMMFSRVEGFVLSNPVLNGIILFVFVVGVFACFWQVLQLVSSVKWIEGFAVNHNGDEMPIAPRLLAPLAALLRSRGARMQIGAASSRSILDSVGTRIDEARDITRYIVNLLVFLGLLGTFYGLATTVPGLVETIRSLAGDDSGDASQGFARLMSGLEKQLGGMGTAFSSSLLGLAGSLLVGLMELFAGHAQSRFYRDLEEWLSTITRVGFSEGEGGDQGALAGVLDHMSEQMVAMREVFMQTNTGRTKTDEILRNLAASVDKMGQSGGAGQDTDTAQALSRVADGQDALIQLMKQQAEAGGGNVDAESRMRLRSIDVQLLRVLEEMSAGRQEITAELRTDLSQLTLALRAVIPHNDGGRGRG